MLIQPVDYALLVWFGLALLSAAYVAYDQWPNNPEPSVMRAGFVLVTLYMGPLGLLLYVLADKEPHPGAHEEFVRPLWKQARFIAWPETPPALFSPQSSPQPLACPCGWT